nr:FUSC family protein [Sphingomonas insulae]
MFSANCFVAAMLALFVSFSLGLDRPFWAMATVYITSQPLSGAVRSKAVYRIAGTTVGGLVTVILVPALVNAPVLLSLALALWVAGCQFVSLLDRTPRAYLFMLAGYTAALIGFPAVTHPEAIFDIAVLRVQEIGIGVLCASLMHSLVFPRNVSAVFGARAKAVLAEAEGWIADVLAAEPSGATARERRRLAADVTDLHVTATHIPFDTARIRPTRAMLTGLQDRLVQLIPLVSAVEDRMRVLAGRGAAMPPAATAAIRAWVLDPMLPRPAAALPTAAGDWDAMLRLNLATRLNELVTALAETRALVAAIADPAAPRPADIAVAVRPLHRDYGIALLSATATMLAVLGCCLFWIVTGWPEGAIAAMIAAVVCCFFATLDDPVPAQRGFLIWTIASLPLAAVYLFAVLPAVHGFAMLALALAPPLLALGTLMAIPAWYGRMMPMLIGFSSGLALTNIYAVDAAGFFNSNIAQVIGVAAAMMTTRLIRSIGAGTAIRRLRRAGWRDLAALVERPAQIATWRSRMVDRIGLLAARIGEVEEEERDGAAAALRELRMGLSLAQLAGDPHHRPLVQALGGHFRDLTHGDEASPPPALLDHIDQAIAKAEPGAIASLVGLRRNVFPAAPGWGEPRLVA